MATTAARVDPGIDVTEPLRYTVDLTNRAQHLLGVTLTLPTDLAASAHVAFATWTPGSYVLRHYARHVQWIRANDNNGTCTLDRDGLGSWRVPDHIVGPVTITLELYANDLTVRTNHVDDHHALIIPAATFPFVEAARDRRHEVKFVGTDDELFSLLPHLDAHHVAADNFDHLIDGAFEVGDLPAQTFTVDDVPHTFVWAGHGPTPDLSRIATDITAIAQHAAAVCGDGLPIDRYVMLCLGWDVGGGGLEHRDGAVIQVPIRTFADDDRYARFLALVAHEYFHIWNVKRLTPQALVRPDFRNPTLTSSLWVAEGWTAYYDELLPTRAQCWSASRFLTHLSDMFRSIADTPAVLLQSLQQASHDAWIKHYVRDENAVNSSTDYYNHGAAVACELDLRIRVHTDGRATLDTVVRLLWERHATSANGYTEQDVSAAIAAVGGAELAALVEQRVAHPEPPCVDDDLLASVGLQWQSTPSTTPDFGAQLREDDHGITVVAVLRDRPAWQAGLTGGDRLIAIDGTTVQRGEMDSALRANSGGTIDVTLLRGPRLLTHTVALGQSRDTVRIVPVADASQVAVDAFRAWTGHALPRVAPADSPDNGA